MPETTQKPAAQAPLTNFEELLPELDGGVFVQKIGRAISDAAVGAVGTGKKATVTVTFTLRQIGESSQVQMDHAIKYVVPRQRGRTVEEDTTATPLHVGPRGRLTLFPEPTPLFPDKRGD